MPHPKSTLSREESMKINELRRDAIAFNTSAAALEKLITPDSSVEERKNLLDQAQKLRDRAKSFTEQASNLENPQSSQPEPENPNPPPKKKIEKQKPKSKPSIYDLACAKARKLGFDLLHKKITERHYKSAKNRINPGRY